MRSIKSKMTESDSRLGECLSLFSKRNVKWWLFAFLLTFKGWDQNQFRPRWFFFFRCLKREAKICQNRSKERVWQGENMFNFTGNYLSFYFFANHKEKGTFRNKSLCFFAKIDFFLWPFFIATRNEQKLGRTFFVLSSSSSSYLFRVIKSIFFLFCFISFWHQKKGGKEKDFSLTFLSFLQKILANTEWFMECRKSKIVWGWVKKRPLLFGGPRGKKSSEKSWKLSRRIENGHISPNSSRKKVISNEKKSFLKIGASLFFPFSNVFSSWSWPLKADRDLGGQQRPP